MAYQGNECFFTLEGVSKTFRLPLTNPFKPRGTVRALDSVNLGIPRGRITCLLGPNGAGKTTLIKILASLVTPDSGVVLYGGKPWEQSRRELQGRIGLVTPNERAFYWRLSGRENLRFFASLHGHRGAELGRRVGEVLEETGMSDSADKPYRLYSAGMKQKLNIARALLGNPELYLLDEPAAHLDPLAREEFRNFITETLVGKRGATIFLCTHDLEEARELAQEIVILDSGRVVAQGSQAALADALGAKREAVLTFAGEMPAAWMKARGAAARLERPGRVRVAFDPGKEDQEDVLASFQAAGGRLREARSEGASLLDLIKRLGSKHA